MKGRHEIVFSPFTAKTASNPADIGLRDFRKCSEPSRQKSMLLHRQSAKAVLAAARGNPLTFINQMCGFGELENVLRYQPADSKDPAGLFFARSLTKKGP
jgi:hypothetical protein